MTNRLVLMAALVLGGCSVNSGNSMEQFKSQQWQLAGAKGDTFTLQVAGDRLAGRGGCNRYFGAIEQIDASTLTLGPVGATRMMCVEGDLSAREGEFFGKLGQVKGYAIAGDRLELKSADGAVLLTFESRGAAR
ncbi:META domain-containing protein [Aeromonas schubertii]|uniref:META domain-containing protein n=1 Tax=Aeromonas schubertii TaxID=652 RepID=UPI0038B42D78